MARIQHKCTQPTKCGYRRRMCLNLYLINTQRYRLANSSIEHLRQIARKQGIKNLHSRGMSKSRLVDLITR